MTPGSVAHWRLDTPGCASRNHLNNAGAALMPEPVVDAIRSHISLEAAIGGYEAAAERAEAIARTYDALAALVGAAARNMAVVASATSGFVQAMSSFDLRSGDVIVTTKSDYTSYQIHFLALARRLGVTTLHAADLPEGGVDPDSVRRLASHPRCRLVHVSWVPTHSGLVQDVEGVGAVCEALGVPYLIDACQVAGQIPIDVARLRCDYLSVTARKFLRGPRGIGFLYASDRALARGDHPLFVDMRGATWTGTDRYTLADGAMRYEDWEFPYALVMGLAEAARYALRVGIAEGGQRAAELAARLRTSLRGARRISVLDRGTTQCAIVTVALEGLDARDAVTALADRKISTAASLRWYGLLDFTERGVETAVRLSPHYYNTEAEVDAAADALRTLVAAPVTDNR